MPSGRPETGVDAACDRSQLFDAAASAAFFAGSADCIKILDLDGRLVTLSTGGQAALELDRPDQLDGMLWWELWPAPQSLLAQRAFEAARRGEVATFSEACPTARGTERHWEVTASPIRDPQRKVERVLIVSRDVSGAVHANRALQEADARKNEILTTVAHELRNPLSAAVSATEFLQRASPAPAELARLAALIGRQLKQMASIAEDLIDTSNIERGVLGAVMRPVDLNLIGAQVFEQMQAAAAQKGQALHLVACEGGCGVTGDEARLAQALGNLVSNAIRYTPTRGRIDIRVSREGSWASATVSDSGIGLAPHQLPTLFDRYVKVGSDSQRASAGLGLGVSLVRAIMTLHGGTVTAASPGLSMGSVFTLRMPLVPA